MAKRDPLHPLQRQIKVVQWTDSEMRHIAHKASQEAERIVRTASDIRGAQAKLAAVNVEMWAGVKDATVGGIGDGVYAGLEHTALFDEDLMTRAGVSSRYWKASQLATAQQGVKNLVSRKQNGITLSQRVWRNSQVAQKGLNDAINVGLALNKSPVEIARDVRKYVSPDVPGGASYAAMRLGRTEVLNAYHTTTVEKYKETPWVEQVRWNTSGSHGPPDECDEYEHIGLYRPADVPDKPHPNCLCFITPEPMNLDRYVEKFKAGEFDNYIDKQMGCGSLVG